MAEIDAERRRLLSAAAMGLAAKASSWGSTRTGWSRAAHNQPQEAPDAFAKAVIDV